MQVPLALPTSRSLRSLSYEHGYLRAVSRCKEDLPSFWGAYIGYILAGTDASQVLMSQYHMVTMAVVDMMGYIEGRVQLNLTSQRRAVLFWPS
jgi:hypothetical protein